MEQLKKFSFFATLFLFLFIGTIFSQTSPKPTTPSGTNSLTGPFSEVYYFSFNSEVIYKYNAANGGGAINSGATFHAITAKSYNGNWFYPSNVGGVSAWLSSTNIMPWDVGVTFNRISGPTVSGLTVTTRWRMTYNSDYIEYEYKVSISGKTLVINVEALNSSTKATGLQFDRCENATGARNVRVPYLTYLNLLYCDNSYTSLFVDWETTNASEIIPFDYSEYSYSTTSKRFAQKISYYPKTDGVRNTLKETVYLTVSSNINEVLPNLVGGPAPYKSVAASKTVLSYFPPYTWLLKPPSNHYYISAFLSDSRYSGYSSQVNSTNVAYGTSYKIMHLLNELGVEGLNVIVKNYQYAGFDRELPDVLQNGLEPAPTGFFISSCTYEYDNIPNNGGSSYMDNLRKSLVDTLNYGFGLHEQYVDCYGNAPSYSTFGKAKKSDGSLVVGWDTKCDGTYRYADIIKPTEAGSLASTWSDNTHLGKFDPTFSYLDVHSAVDPSAVVDYENGVDGAGLFRKVLEKYRAIPGILRNTSNYGNIPIQGEGGKGMMLYVGHFDDIEARLLTADYTHYGLKVPLLVDFSLYKMHSKSALHGVGHFNSFFASTYNDDSKGNMTTEETLTYIASELAYGHSGLVTKANEVDHTVEQAVLEYNHVYPSQLLISNSTPSSITYYLNGSAVGTASQYIKNYSAWDKYDSTNFMSQVRVVYANNIRVYVNRDRDSEWNISSEVNGLSGRFYYNIKNGTSKLQGVGTTPPNYTVAKENGWMVFIPSNLISQLQKDSNSDDGLYEETISNEYTLYNNYPNPFNPTTTIKYSIPKNSFVTLKIYDILGSEIQTLVNELKEPGAYEVKFNGTHLSSGIYFYRITAGNFTETKKLILMK